MRTLRFLIRVLLLLGAALAVPVLADYTRPAVVREVKTIERVDTSEFNLIIKRPVGVSNLPLLVLVDGTGCYSAEWIETRHRFTAPPELQDKVAVLIVDKPGIELGAGPQDTCPAEFKQYYSIDRRVQDHLRALQHLRTYADWWNGKLVVNGYSDGAAVAAMLAAYYPDVQRLALGGLGGGVSMADWLAGTVICANADDLPACKEQVEKQFDQIRTTPIAGQSWGGDDNTYKAWASRLDNVEFTLLRDMTIPVLIYHGQLDREGVPVEAARKLMEKLEPFKRRVTYWEIPQMRHSFSDMSDERASAIWNAVNLWTLGLEPGEGGPPTFGRDD